ncbi:hypothetical protein [Marinobacterium sp. MBR-111]|uniref:hypothetical protein n=1 Tax=Marinobacterium sp. MBR-111 TaxID=3156463 RepID=UPI003393DE22
MFKLVGISQSRLDVEIDVTTAGVIIHTRSKQQNAAALSKVTAQRGDDDLVLFWGQAHGCLK